jgi:hypothetical protein
MDKRIELLGFVCHVTLSTNFTYHVKITEGLVPIGEFNADTFDEGPNSAQAQVRQFFRKKVDDAFSSCRAEEFKLHENVEKACEHLRTRQNKR